MKIVGKDTGRETLVWVEDKGLECDICDGRDQDTVHVCMPPPFGVSIICVSCWDRITKEVVIHAERRGS